MARRPRVPMDDEKAVLAANDEFYRAFADGDFPAMDELWAKEGPIACIHPGGPVLSTRADVMESWFEVLGSPNRPRIRCQKPIVFLHGDFAFVTCYEELGGGFLVATNLFTREGGVWRMVHHQAGPTATAPRRDRREPETGPRTVH